MADDSRQFDVLVVTGRVETRSAPNAGDFVNLKIGNVDHISTKLPALLDGLDAGIWVKAAYTEAPGTGMDRAGRPFVNRRLVRWEPVEKPQADALTQPTSRAENIVDHMDGMSKADWAAKDRAVWMQSSYRTAAEFLDRGNLNELSLQAVARLIYADVQRAWEGDAFSGDTVQDERERAIYTPNNPPSVLDAHFGPKPQAAGIEEQASIWVAAFDGAPDFAAARKCGEEMPDEFRDNPEVKAAMKRAAERLKSVPA